MSEQTAASKDSTSTENTQSDTGDLDYGYDFYPERRHERKKGVWGRLTQGLSDRRKYRCEINVHWCIQNSEYCNFYTTASIVVITIDIFDYNSMIKLTVSKHRLSLQMTISYL